MPNPDHRNRLRRRSAAPRLTWLLLLGLGLFSPAALAEGMIVRALRFLGVTASPAQLKDAEEPSPGGQVMVSDLGTPTPKKLTNDGVFAWPIFSLDGKTVLALNGAGSLVTIARDGSAPPRSRKVPGLRKLVGIDREQPDQVLVLLDDPKAPVGVLALGTGKVTRLPYDPKDDGQRRMLSHLESEERYYGDQRLFICPQTKMALEGMRTWSEICLQRAGGEARAISACANRSCRQPALSADGKSAVYVKVAH